MRFLSTGLLWIAGEPDIYGQPTYSNAAPIALEDPNTPGTYFVTAEGELLTYGMSPGTSPVSVRHRWEDKSGLFINANGRQEAFKSRVYIDVLPRPGDRISKRASDGLAGSLEIKDVREIINVSGKKREVRVLL